MLKNVLHRPGTSIHGLLEKKKLRANTAGRQAHQVEIHFKLHQKSRAITIFLFFLFRLSSTGTAQLTAYFAPRDARVSRELVGFFLPKENSI